MALNRGAWIYGPGARRHRSFCAALGMAGLYEQYDVPFEPCLETSSSSSFTITDPPGSRMCHLCNMIWTYRSWCANRRKYLSLLRTAWARPWSTEILRSTKFRSEAEHLSAAFRAFSAVWSRFSAEPMTTTPDNNHAPFAGRPPVRAGPRWMMPNTLRRDTEVVAPSLPHQFSCELSRKSASCCASASSTRVMRLLSVNGFCT